MTVLVLSITGCGSAGPGSSGEGEAMTRTGTARVVRGPIESTLVLPAEVVASPAIVLTARVEGRYTMRGGRLMVQTSGGGLQPLELPAGVVIDELTAPPDVVLPANHPIATAHVDGFALVGQLDTTALYRVYDPPTGARGQIDEGPGPFACPLVDLVPQAATDQGASLTCVIPRDLRVFAGMPALLSVRTGSDTEALLLPLEAVAGDAETGTVLVVRPSGPAEARVVQLGITDGNRIVIKSGLNEGDVVQIPGPDLGGRA